MILRGQTYQITCNLIDKSLNLKIKFTLKKLKEKNDVKEVKIVIFKNMNEKKEEN